MSSLKKPKKVAILIPTYNGERYIDELFQSIQADSYPKEYLGIFVVDNASRDNTVVVIAKEAMPTVAISDRLNITLIQNKTNLYFAKAINQAATAAIEAGYEYLFLLNQDTAIQSGCIESLVNQLVGNPELAVVQARMMLYAEVPPPKIGGGEEGVLRSQDSVVNSLGNAIHYLGFGFSVGNGKQWPLMLSPRPNGERVRVRGIDYTQPSWLITYASGGAMMVSVNIWKEFSGLEESLEMYHEDLDFGWRLMLAGKTSVCVRDAVVYHKYSFNPAPYKYYFMERNRMIVLLAHYRLWTLLLITPMLLAMELGMMVFSFKNGWWREKLRSYRDIARLLPQICTMRQKSALLRKVSDRDILKKMESTIKDQPVSNFILDRIGNPILALYYRFLRSVIR